MKLFLDENLSSLQAQLLRESGLDAIAALELNLSGASDEEIRKYAINDNRVLVTLDADFGNLLRFSPINTPGVLFLRIDKPTESKITEIINKSIIILKNIDITNKLAVYDGKRIRVRSSIE